MISVSRERGISDSGLHDEKPSFEVLRRWLKSKRQITATKESASAVRFSARKPFDSEDHLAIAKACRAEQEGFTVSDEETRGDFHDKE